MSTESTEIRVDVDNLSDGGLHRGLKSRHVQLIALGGIIGSGYFLGTGAIIDQVGPAVFIAYALGGLIIYLTMLCLGELAVAIPISGSFVTYTADFISPTLACGTAWSYWLNWVAYIPAECVAGGIIMHAFTGVSGYFWATLFGLIITLINVTRVHLFGEIEFWLALIKIFALIGFVFLAILIFLGIIHGKHPAHLIGGQYIFGQGGLFPKGALSVLTTMILLLVNYQGSEIIGLAAGELQEPSKHIPRAIRNVTFRIVCLYIIPVFCLVLIFPWQKAGLSNSVFADALDMYGLHWAGAAASFVTLIAAISCANSGFYGTVRALHALGRDKMAPEYLGRLNKHRVPQNAVMTTLAGIWLLLGVGYFFGQSQVYIALLLVSGFTGTLCWITLCWSQINFRKRLYQAGYSVKDLQFKTPGSPYTGILAILLMLGCLLMLFFNPDPTFRLAFIIGTIGVIAPIIIYKALRMDKEYHPPSRIVKRRLRFEDIFPHRSPGE